MKYNDKLVMAFRWRKIPVSERMRVSEILYKTKAEGAEEGSEELQIIRDQLAEELGQNSSPYFRLCGRWACKWMYPRYCSNYSRGR